jgi:hypothetical protein
LSKKNGSGHVLGDFFTNSSGHPAGNAKVKQSYFRYPRRPISADVPLNSSVHFNLFSAFVSANVNASVHNQLFVVGPKKKIAPTFFTRFINHAAEGYFLRHLGKKSVQVTCFFGAPF